MERGTRRSRRGRVEIRQLVRVGGNVAVTGRIENGSAKKARN